MQRTILFCLLLSFALISCNKNSEENILDRDIESIEKYLSDNNISAEKDDSGVFIEMLENGGGGDAPVAGSVLAMYFEMSTLEGNVLIGITNTAEERRIESLVRGWQIGATRFSKGAKGRIYIPSPLGYGAWGQFGLVGPDEILIVEMELVNIL